MKALRNGLVCLIGTSALLTPGAASAAPGLRLSFTNPQGLYLQHLTATRDGHVFGVDLYSAPTPSNGNATATTIRHWDGRAWSALPLPAPPKGEYFFDIVPSIVATSKNDLWFASTTQKSPGWTTGAQLSHWDGSRWTTSRIRINDLALPELTLVGGRPLIVVGYRQKKKSITQLRRYDGRRWVNVTKAPPIPISQVSARSTRDIWVSGGSKANQIARWDGRRWKITKLPRIKVPRGYTLDVDQVLRTGRKTAVATVAFNEIIDTGRKKAAAPPASLLLRWNGRSWKTSGSFHGTTGTHELRSDDKGGFWTSARLPSGANRLVHYPAKGKPVSYPVPKVGSVSPNADQPAPVPGSSTVWLSAYRDHDNANYGTYIYRLR